MSKLKNIKALNQMLSGEHRLQTRKTIGFSDTAASEEKNKKREVGEIWEEPTGPDSSIWWEQKDGYRIKHHYHPNVANELKKIREYLASFPNCQKEVCTCTSPTYLDHRFRKMVGMCHDCLVTMETKMKMEGTFNEYALEKMKQNALDFFKQADIEVEIIKESMKDVSFVNSEKGDVEKWNIDDVDVMIKKVEDSYRDFKNKTLERFENK